MKKLWFLRAVDTSSSARRMGLVVALLLPITIIATIFWNRQFDNNCLTKSTHANNTHNNTESSDVTQNKKQHKVPVHTVDETNLKPRAFPIYNYTFPCYEPENDWNKKSVQRSPGTKEGFFFVKEMKTGSSTLSGITIRISINVAKRLGREYDLCRSRFDHTYAYKMEYGKRDRFKSFLWTVIREPNSRAASQFFHFEVSRKKVEPSDVNFKNQLKGISYDNIYFQTLGLVDYMGVEDEVTFANQIIADYDFIGITERMDESLVVLSMLLKLELKDVLYLSSKASGSFDDAGGDECNYIVPAFISPGMKEYFSSDQQWNDRTKGDAMLYRAAYRSLDMTIDKLGQDEFASKLSEFKIMLKVVEDKCLEAVTFPCDAGGKKQQHDCLWEDSGCGNSCIDRAIF